MFLNILELMAVFSNVFENVISMLLCISPNVWPYQLLMVFIILFSFELLDFTRRVFTRDREST